MPCLSVPRRVQVAITKTDENAHTRIFLLMYTHAYQHKCNTVVGSGFQLCLKILRNAHTRM